MNWTFGECVVLKREGDICLIGMIDIKSGYEQYTVPKSYKPGKRSWDDGVYCHTLEQALAEFKVRCSKEIGRVCD